MYPKFKNAYMKTIEHIYKNGAYAKLKSAKDVYNWWLSDETIDDYIEKKKQLKINFA